jgi:L-threonylcarbamoyladenylate synthase
VSVKIVKIDAGNPTVDIIDRAAKLIAKGGVVVCPTDTGYAFSANALDVRAITRVFQLKGRSYTNPIHIAVDSIDEADKYAVVDDTVRHLAARFLPGGLTLVLYRRESVPSMLVAGRDTVGIRIPNNKVILSLVKKCGKPLTTTSANISAQPTPYSVEEIVKQMGENIKNIDLILDQGPIVKRELSTIVDLTASPPQLIRQGRVSWLEVREELHRLQDAD